MRLLAYVDPVSGSIILQALIAGVIGIMVFFRNSLARLVGLVRPAKAVEAVPAAAPQTEPSLPQDQ